MSGLRILVTGSQGRLGRSTVEHLRGAGHEAVGVDVQTGAHTELAADLTDAAAALDVVGRVRPHAIVHLAAIAVAFSAPEHTIMATNSALAFNLCQAGAEHGVDAVAVASSPTLIGYGNPHGWQPAYLPIDEDHPVAPWHAYGLSKVVAEETVRTFSRASGGRTSFSAVRPCYVIAPEEWEGAPTQQGQTVQERLDNPEHAAVALFNYIDARDAAALFERVVTDGRDAANGEVFFASAPDALATRPLSELLPRFHPGTEEAAAHLGEGQPAFSSDKARRLLGWEARRSWRSELIAGAAPADGPHAMRSAP